MSSENEKNYDNLKCFLCLVIIVIFALIGRVILIACGGYKFPKFLHKFNLIKLEPLFTKFKLPYIIGEILCGIIARNAFTGKI